MLILFAACQPGERVIAAKVRSYDNHGSNFRMSWTAAQSERAALDITPLASHASFDKYAEFYGEDNLGAHVADITPTKLNVTAAIEAFDPQGNWLRLGNANFDFASANGVTLTIGEIPTGVTCAGIEFMFTPTVGDEIVTSTVEFEWPDGETAFDEHTMTSAYDKNPQTGEAFDTWNGDKGTLAFNNFLPYQVQNWFSLTSDVGSFYRIIYGAGERRILTDDIPLNEIAAGGTPNGDWVDIPNEGNDTFIIPFDPVDVPDSASSITLHLSWNLDGLIAQYEGATDDPNDDIFVLKDGWWDGLHLYADVQ